MVSPSLGWGPAVRQPLPKAVACYRSLGLLLVSLEVSGRMLCMLTHCLGCGSA